MSLLLNLIFIWISLAIGYCLGDMGCFFFPLLRKSFHPCPLSLHSRKSLLCSCELCGPLPCQAVFQAQVGFGTAGSHGAPPPGEEIFLASGKTFFFFFFLAFIHSSFAFWLCEKKFLIESNPMNSIQTLHYWFFRPTHSIMPLHCWLSSVSIHHLLGDPRVIFFVFSQEGALTSIFPHPKLMIWIHVWLNRSATLLLCGSKQSTLGLRRHA